MLTCDKMTKELIKATIEIRDKYDIVNLFSDDFKMTFEINKLNECMRHDGNITSKYTKEQFIVETKIINKNNFIRIYNKDKAISFFEFKLKNMLKR